MKDTFDRDIKPGDLVAYASSQSNAYLSIGRVVRYCKNGSDAIRVEVFKSNHCSFEYGTTDWRTGKVRRKPGSPYVVTLTRPEYVVVINGADIPGAQ